jgi:hypothetical protein
MGVMTMLTKNPHKTAIRTTMSSFWSDPSMTADDAIAELKEQHDIMLG